MTKFASLLISALCTSFFSLPATAEQISIVGWNVENWGTSSPAKVATQLRDHFDSIDVFGLSEVNDDSDYALYADYASRDESGKYKVIPGTTGNNVRLGIMFRDDKFVLEDTYELVDLQFGGGGRAPLVAHLKSKQGGAEFLFVVNHLQRGDKNKRLDQAIGLREWARNEPLPIVAVGDYNFDFDVTSKTGNDAYDAFLEDNIWSWVQPNELVATNWSDTDPKDGENDYDSVLDFVFVRGEKWKGVSTILVRQNDFPDDEYTSDHGRSSLRYRSTKNRLSQAWKN